MASLNMVHLIVFVLGLLPPSGAISADDSSCADEPAPRPPALPQEHYKTYTVVGEVQRKQWGLDVADPNGFALPSAKLDVPVVLTGTAYAARSPLQWWTPARLAANIPKNGRMENVKRYPPLMSDDGRYRLFESGLPLRQVADAMSLYAPHFSRHNMSAETFFKYIRGEGGEGQESGEKALFSYSGNLFLWPDLENDLEIAPLVPLEADATEPKAIKK